MSECSVFPRPPLQSANSHTHEIGRLLIVHKPTRHRCHERDQLPVISEYEVAATIDTVRIHPYAVLHIGLLQCLPFSTNRVALEGLAALEGLSVPERRMRLIHTPDSFDESSTDIALVREATCWNCENADTANRVGRLISAGLRTRLFHFGAPDSAILRYCPRAVARRSRQ